MAAVELAQDALDIERYDAKIEEEKQ